MSRTFCRKKRKRQQISRERSKRRERASERGCDEGVKGENDTAIGGSLRWALFTVGHVYVCVCVSAAGRCLTVRCVRKEKEKEKDRERGEINKHIKPRDSFTLDKNMSRDTYLDPPPPYLVGLPSSSSSSISSFSFSRPLVAPSLVTIKRAKARDLQRDAANERT